MRITNGMINNNTKANIMINKEYSDKLNTMVANGQKITRPSDDPVIAIRALRLNSNISEINQFYDKNIPDAEAWLQTTETALSQTESVLSSVQEYLTQGASDDNTAQDRMNILENLRALKDQLYSAGNSDYAGRTVFTGFRTGESLTYKEAEKDLINIVETFDETCVETMTYISGDFSVDSSSIPDTPTNQTDITSSDVYRIRLAYSKLTSDQMGVDGATIPSQFSITMKDGTTKDYSVDVVELSADQATNDSYYTDIGDDEVRLITTTGELIIGKNVREAMQSTGSTASFEYSKEEWEKNDPRPEHYFACRNYDDASDSIVEYNYDDSTDPSTPDFKNQKISYEIAYNQKVDINTNANEVFSTSITRDVDELLDITQSVIDAEKKVDTLNKMKSDSSYSEEELKNISTMYDAAVKEFDMLKEKMQNMFSKGLTTFKGYSDSVNLRISYVGSMRARVELTKERVGEQLSNFKELADSNINAELTETAIDLKNAELALEAAQAAAAKVAKQTLLNYL